MPNAPIDNGSGAGNGDNENRYDHLVQEVNSAPIEVKERIFKEALKSAEQHGNAVDLVRHTIGTASLMAKTAAVKEAVETCTDRDEQQKVLEQGFKEAHASTQGVLADKYAPHRFFRVSQQVLDDIWRWITTTFAVVLVASIDSSNR